MGSSDPDMPAREAPPGAGSARRLARSAGIVGAATMASRVLGMARDVLLAYFFGAGNQMDAFYLAFRIPNLFRDLFAEGALSAAFVPAFTRRLTRGGLNDAWRLGNLVVNALLVVTLTLVILGVVFAQPLVVLFASDYARVPGKLELTVSLARILFPFLTLVGLAAACMGMLNSLDRFFVPAFAPAMFNVGTVVSVLALVPTLPLFGVRPIFAVAIGALAGGIGQVAVQLPGLWREGFRYRPVLDWRDPALREVLVLMGPGAIGLAAVQINVFVNTILATAEGTGAVSWLNYAFRLMYLPIGLFGLSIATAALPALSGQAARQQTAAMRQTLSRGLRMMLMLNVPATAGLIALAGPIVALLFQRGSFTPADTAATAAALTCYAPGLVGYSVVKIAVRTFYALRDSRTPVIVTGVSVLVNVALNVALAPAMGYRGLALGTALAALFNAGVLLWLLWTRLEGLEGRRLATAFVKITIASVVMAAAAATTEAWLHGMLPGGDLLSRAVRVGIAIGVALLVLTLVARALRVRELGAAVDALRSRMAPLFG
jgi:putative peptidoglycan lipid II flippase